MLDMLRKRVAMALFPESIKRADSGIRFVGAQMPNVPIYTDMTIQRATRQGYKISIYVFRAVRTIIQAASAIPW